PCGPVGATRRQPGSSASLPSTRCHRPRRPSELLEVMVEHRTARRALLAAAIAGVGAELLFDRQPLGIGVPVFVVGLLALAAWFSPGVPGAGRGRPADPLDWWLAGAALAASLGPAFRTDPTVVFLD